MTGAFCGYLAYQDEQELDQDWFTRPQEGLSVAPLVDRRRSRVVSTGGMEFTGSSRAHLRRSNAVVYPTSQRDPPRRQQQYRFSGIYDELERYLDSQVSGQSMAMSPPPIPARHPARNRSLSTGSSSPSSVYSSSSPLTPSPSPPLISRCGSSPKRGLHHRKKTFLIDGGIVSHWAANVANKTNDVFVAHVRRSQHIPNQHTPNTYEVKSLVNSSSRRPSLTLTIPTSRYTTVPTAYHMR